jgi:5'-3' exonuclease
VFDSLRGHHFKSIPHFGNNIKALIDGDIVVHRVGYTTDSEPLGIARARTDEMIEKILHDTKAEEYEIWLSDSYENNFRKHLMPEYKANRTAPRPVHYQALKDYLFEHWDGNLALGMEADDALGIQQRKNYGTWEDHPCLGTDSTIICSIDKDLLQIPGWHYNFVREEWAAISQLDGIKHFYKQMLIGDVADNIRGVTGIGKVGAGKLIDPLTKEYDMFAAVREKFYADAKTDDDLLLTGRLFWIRKEDNQVWNFPTSA